MFKFKLGKQKAIRTLVKPTMKLCNGDCVNVMKSMKQNSLDSIVTDIPQDIKIMGKDWDNYRTPQGYQLFNQQWGQEAFRVLKPGSHMVVFLHTKTQHRAVAGLEDVGFEIRELCFFLHSMGFNHGYDQAQCIEKLLTLGSARRPDRDLGKTRNRWNGGKEGLAQTGGSIVLTQKEAIAWNGWNSTLKPCMEPCVLVRKPLDEKNVALNLLKWGVGALNTKDCRILSDDNKRTKDGSRHPGNILHDGSVLPESLERFFYCAKTSTKEKATSKHPTQKPIALMEYFIKMVTPKGGTILDPFMGSNSTGIAANKLGFNYIGIEKDEEEFKGASRKTFHHLNKDFKPKAINLTSKPVDSRIEW